MAEVRMPQLGETVTEGTITRWFKQVGDEVDVDEVLFEVSTDKVDTEVPSPVRGVLTEILAEEGATVEVGAVLARVGEDGQAPAEAPAEQPAAEEAQAEAPPAEPEPAAPAEPAAQEPAPAAAAPPAEQAPAPPEQPQPAPAPEAERGDGSGTSQLLSPVVRRLIAEHDLDPGQIVGTGVGGRITRSDVERAIQEIRSGRGAQAAPAAAAPAPAAPAPAPAAARPAAAPQRPPAPTPEPLVRAGGGDTVVPLNNIRRRTAEHMVMSKHTSPHVLTAVEVDYEAVERVRRAHGQRFKEEEGFSLTYMPFIARALVDALHDFPYMNASMGDGELIVHHRVNLAVAVDLNFEGLLAPVVKDADGKRMRAIARDIVDLARRARSKQLSADDIMDGTFTITNAGSFGTMMQFPIINQPQVAILSTDAVTRKPVVVTDEWGTESIAIHSVGILALAWDHRAFDGAYAAAFLARLRENLETRDWEAEL